MEPEGPLGGHYRNLGDHNLKKGQRGEAWVVKGPDRGHEAIIWNLH